MFHTPPRKDNKAQQHTVKCKLVMLGEAGVGKSSLALRLVKKVFVEYQESSIGAAFLTHDIKLSDRDVHFEIWDTAGQERYHSLAPMYYRGASAALVVYDVTSYSSFLRAKSWVEELKRACGDITIALAGNKVDLPEDQRKVNLKEAQSFAAANDLMLYETSAKTNLTVDKIFEKIAAKLPNRPAQHRSIVIEKTDDEQEQKSRCCIK